MKMFAFTLLLIFFSSGFANVRCGVLIWGSQSLQIPSLKQFNNEDFDLLKSYLRNPKIIAFEGDPTNISPRLQDLLRNKYTAYTPNCNVDIEDVIELNGDADENYKTVKTKLEENNDENVVALIISAKSRTKRDIETSTEIELTESIYEPPSGPVLYIAEDKEKYKDVVLIYSSKPPILRTNSSTLILGDATIGTLDNRVDKYTKLSVTIITIEGKITLRFKFPWNAGYWSLTSVELLDTDSKVYTLVVTEEITASRNFSYHCTGQTIFVDTENEIELKLFDLQAQPDSQDSRFSDAYDCIGFTTGPIWSGLFITSILMVVLGIGLAALNSIKTMDKFDNYKTKQLNITTSE